ncbi:sialidase family protein [Arenibacter latericius]|uniref:sialidase family protein n=1 Tax=Arenibacter latericius TaxID=86104 RepID=UPI000406093B|nr:sialidase family protein [Arenibacter latericius]
MKNLVFSLIILTSIITHAQEIEAISNADLISIEKVWGIEQSGKPHNAFTDLIRFKDYWYLGFREALKHHGGLEGKGRLRVIRSKDGENWESCGIFEISEGDLRDAKLSITDDNQLMLNSAIQVYNPNPYKHKNFAWFSNNGEDWGDPIQIAENNVWIWSVTWHNGVAYGVGYHTVGPTSKTRLYRSEDGINWETHVSEFYKGNESSIVFKPNGTAICLMRTGNAIGMSEPPYKEWNWKPTINLGGPKIIMLDDGRFIAGGRTQWGTMVLFEIDPETGESTELIKLPANGDSSYPGMVYHEGILWVSYYTSSDNASEGGRYLMPTEIRLAKVKL